MNTLLNNIKNFEELKRQIDKKFSRIKKSINVCCGPGCLANGSKTIFNSLNEELNKRDLSKDVKLKLKSVGCHGLCEAGPIIAIEPDGLFYCRVKTKDIKEIVEETIIKNKVIEHLLYQDSNTIINNYKNIAFYKKQKRISLINVGQIDPEDIEEYIYRGGYSALINVLFNSKPENVLDIVDKSGLRGRGGGGFKTGRKWKSAVKAKGEKKYVICNGDEGDPGAFMDRAIMEGDPHGVIEGMVIGAYAVGSTEGYVYVREEYPLAVKNMAIAVDKARAYGLLGQNILGTDFSFDIQISRGGGAFVCGESTALSRSIEGRVGEPRAKYVHSVEKGLYDMPTVLNNVETWINIPQIISNGVEWFTQFGTEKSKGTKAFCIVGKVKNTGLIEIPMGTTLREIVYDIGGGIRDNKKFKAVQTGGPSGGFIPESLLDIPVDFDKLTEVGSMMGSGGMIILDENTCMVDVSRYFIHFLLDESCGKCVPCRDGLTQLLYILNRIVKGKSEIDDIARLKSLSDVMMKVSLCALGKSAPNPLLSALKYFENEFTEHILDKKCRSLVCRDLITYSINLMCTGCMVCIKNCPQRAIKGENKKIHVIDQALCDKCGICMSVCKFEAVMVS